MGTATRLNLGGKRRELLLHVGGSAFRADRSCFIQPPVQVAEDLAAFRTFVFVDWHCYFLLKSFTYCGKNNAKILKIKLESC